MSLARLAAMLAVVAAAPVAATAATPERDAAIRRFHDWTGLPARSVVAVSPEMAVALVGRGAPGKTAGRLDGVELQGEVLDEAFAQARGWRSMRLRVDIACHDGGATWARRMTVYPDHGRGGAGRDAQVPSGWVRPKPEAYLGQVVSALCGQAVALNDQTIEPPPPAPEAVPTPKRAPPVLRPAMPLPAAPPAAAASKSPSRPAASPAGVGPSVQIAASPVQAEAEAAQKGAAQRLIAADPALRFHVESALSGGRQVYRAMVSGFADRGAAQRWCASLRAAGGACFIR